MEKPIEISQERQCKNCGEDYDGCYCPSCGQKYIDKRYSLRDGFNHLMAMVLNVDRGLWHTSLMLLRKPGRVIRDYLNGITVPYFHPFRFLFLWLTVQVFIMLTFGIMDESQAKFARDFSGQEVKPIQQELMGMFNSYLHILIALSIPILAWGSRVFFRKAGYNYAEHLIINCFAYGETILLGFIILPVYFIDKQVYLSISVSTFFISIAYFTYVYLSFFEGRKWVIVLKAIGVYLTWFIAFSIITSLLVVVLVFLMAARNPEMLEQLKSING